MAETGAPQEAAEAIPGGRRRWWALAVLATGLSMIIIDGTIVNVALPTIIHDLSLSLSNAQWINGLYSVVFAALLLTTGRLGDRLGRRRLFLTGIVIFIAGSLMASAAGGAASMIWARLVQGIGASAVLPATLSTVNATFRGRDRVVAFAVWGSVISGMAALGPLLGGWLTQDFSWPWIFLINLPIGAAVAIAAVLVVPETRTTITAPGLDVDGFLLSCIGFGGIVFALIEGRTFGWWKPQSDLGVLSGLWPSGAAISPIPVIAAIGVAALALFIVWERHRQKNGRSALTDLGLFGLNTFSWGNLTALVVAIGEFGLLFVLPLLLVNALGLSTIHAGFVLAAMGLGAFVAGASARHLAARVGTTGVVIVGLALETAGTLAKGLVVTAHTSAWLLGLLLACYGIGLGLASAQLTSTVLIDVPPTQSGQGSAVQSTVRQLGAALGTAVLGTVLAAGMAQTLPHHLAEVSHLPHSTAQKLTDATADSGGSNIPQLRSGHGSLGKAGPATAKALSDGYTDAARIALLTGAGFMLVGLVGAVRLRSRARTDPATTGDDDSDSDSEVT